MQRTIIFRGKRLDNGEWVYGGYFKHDKVKVCFTSDDPHTKHCIISDGSCDWGFEPPQEYCEVDPKTVGQFTGMNDFVMAHELRHPIFEGDIMELWSRRRIGADGYWTVKSQYDGDCIVRAVVVFKNGEWRLDYDNAYNNKIAAARGNEVYDRDVYAHWSLYHLIPHVRNMDTYKRFNSHIKRDDIKIIGNIHDNPELLEE